MLLKIHPENPQERLLSKAVEVLQKGGIIIMPTDTIYAWACDAFNNKAIENLCRILGKKPEKANLSMICYDLSNLADYTMPINTATYKLIKKALPGPYTFILNASSRVPKIFKSNKKTIGIRIPDNQIAREIVALLGHPILCASIHSEDEIVEYITDPDEIDAIFEKQADLIIDGGMGDNIPSTVVDLTGTEPVLIRQGKGEVTW
jgi:tRNA threonylcarbamoyl adenosine modification protein (Sua5/YciO/YrdC/YwlC family)